jgi:hypothetical protein
MKCAYCAFRSARKNYPYMFDKNVERMTGCRYLVLILWCLFIYSFEFPLFFIA